MTTMMMNYLGSYVQGTNKTATEKDVPVDESQKCAIRKLPLRVKVHVFEERQTGRTNARSL